MGLFDKIKKGLTRTRQKVAGGFRAVLPFGKRIDEELLTDLEATMLSADMGPATVAKLIETVRAGWKAGRISEAQEIVGHLTEHIVQYWPEDDRRLRFASSGPTTILVTGINGSGKTTSIAKLAHYLKNQGKTVIVGACDTFRAAAVAQLTEWCRRIDVPIIKHQQGSDPGAVAYDACDAAVARKADVLLIDTAGRSPRDDLQIQELKRLLVEANVDEVHLVMSMTSSMRTLEATAEKFSAANTTSLIATKLDEAASMGTLLSLARKIPLPISYLTTGQDVPDDIESARPERIARLVLGEDTLFE